MGDREYLLIPVKMFYIGDEHFQRKGFASMFIVLRPLTDTDEDITPIKPRSVQCDIRTFDKFMCENTYK